jgi:YbbR domain-containing protein
MATATRFSTAGLMTAVTHNIGLKALALVLSILLFSLVHSDVDAQRSVFIDVVALLPPPGSETMLISELPAEVKVTLRGSRSRLSELSRDDFTPIQMDLREPGSGIYYFDTADLEVASGVQVVEIVPSNIPLTWATSAEKRVEIKLRLGGELDRGLKLRDEGQVRPSQVTLRGPKDRLEDIDTVSTSIVSLDGLAVGTHGRRVPLQALPEHVVYLEDTAVDVTLGVEPIVAERRFKRLRVEALGPGSALLRPDRVAVTLRGQQEALDELDAEALVPYVELDPEAEPGTRPLDVRVRGVPDGVEVVGVTPASVLVRVKGKP